MKKIAFIVESSYNSGGMERMLSIIANSLANKFQITVITAFNEDRKDFFPFNVQIKRVDLGIKKSNYKKAKDLKNAYKEKLSNYLLNDKQEITISLGSLEFFFLNQIKDGSKKVFWFHFALNFDIQTCLVSKYKFVNLIVGKLKQWHRIYVAKRFDKVVVLSKSDLKSWSKYTRNVICIYNPLTIGKEKDPDYGVKRAMAVGRIERQKGFDYLVNAWSEVNRLFPDWHLDIYGTSSIGNINILQEQIDRLGLHDIVVLKGRSDDMAKSYSEHSLMILSSRYEGFGLVLLEASVCGLPLISFDCKQGPSEIIENGKNGYLVKPVGNVGGLTKAICAMISDENKRRIMGREAQQMSQRFSLNRISEQWCMMFNSLI